RKDYIGGAPGETIYFGGGTPSLLDAEELETIMDGLRTHFVIDPGAEITLEANPDDIVQESAGKGKAASGGEGRVASWRRAGINRLSIGIQSFFEADLQWMNRAHNAVQAEECIRMAQEEGFRNI